MYQTETDKLRDKQTKTETDLSGATLLSRFICLQFKEIFDEIKRKKTLTENKSTKTNINKNI